MFEAIGNDLVAAFILTVGGSFLGTLAFRAKRTHSWEDWLSRYALRKLFDFPKDKPVHIVVPEWKSVVEGTSQVSLVSWEDMLAANHAMRSLIVAGWHESKIHITILKDGQELCSERRENLLLLCKPDRNGETRRVLNILKGDNRFDFPFLKSPENGRHYLKLGAKPYHSDSYTETADIVGNPYEYCTLMHDYALIAKFANPWDSTTMVVLVAGIRAFGTWGAGHALRKKPFELYKMMKKKDFAVVVKCALSGLKVGECSFEDYCEIRPKQSTGQI